jgi:hypothetical protein
MRSSWDLRTPCRRRRNRAAKRVPEKWGRSAAPAATFLSTPRWVNSSQKPLSQ